MSPDQRIPWYRSIRLRLVAAAALVEVVMLTLLVANSYRLVSDALESQTRSRLEALAPLLDASLAGRVFQRDHSEISAVIRQLVGSKLTEIRYIVVFDHHGEVLASTGDVTPELLANTAPEDASVAVALADLTYDTSVPLTLAGNVVGSARFGLSLDGLATLRGNVLHQSVMIALGEILLSLLLLTTGGLLITRHIASLAAATRRIASADYSTPIAIASRDEIGLLADNFNAMAAIVKSRIGLLAESESRFRSIFDAAADAIFIHDGETGRLLDVNRRMCEMYGCSRDQALLATIADISANVEPFTMDKAIVKLSMAMRDGPQTFDWLARRYDDGRQFWVEVRLLRARIGELDRIIALVRDISERKRDEATLRLYASVFAHSYEGIVITDANNVIVDVNPAFTRITGYTRDETVGHTPGMLASGREGPEFFARMWRSISVHDFWQGELWNRRKNGEAYAERLAISVVRDGAGALQHYIGVFSDISQIKAHEAELHHIAHYDVLTGVPNRRLLADRLGLAIAHARRGGMQLAVCYLDLDGFKPINDRYGHAAGDRLLVEVTERLKAVLRADDTLARLGGDEFVLLLVDLTQMEETHVVLERVLAAVRTPLLIEDATVDLSASIGVTLYPLDDADADTLLRHADQAMYRAKEAGKNRYHLFDAEHDRQVKAHFHHLQRLREALTKEEFVLHYQPKVDLVSGAVVGAEALIRWQHPERGLLAPGEFLHYLDGSDMESVVGEWVIESVLRQIRDWNAAGLALTVSANVSADHLLQADFAERLQLALERHPEVRPGSLELEILETAALANMEQAVLALTRCRRLGVHFSLDDFGTGYSSLSYLRNLPVDILKIDQSFVRDMLDDPNDLGIVESVVQLAGIFNRQVIAEGVESLELGTMLIHLGCRLAQGYGIARPMPAGELPAWGVQWHAGAPWLAMPNRSMSRENMTLLVAAQSHRNWIRKIVAHLERPAGEGAPTVDVAHCHFGRWYNSGGSATYGDFHEYVAIAPLHDRAHRLAAEILDLADGGHAEAAAGRMPELYQAQNELLAQIDALIAAVAKSRR